MKKRIIFHRNLLPSFWLHWRPGGLCCGGVPDSVRFIDEAHLRSMSRKFIELGEKKFQNHLTMF